jgi:hypothetical protein
MAEWKVRRGDSELPVESVARLQEWARSGRLSSSDYIFNPILEKWMYAEDVLEIRPLFTHTATSQNTSSTPPTTAGAPVALKPPSAKKSDWRQKIAVGITAIIVGIVLITISPRLVTERAYSYSYVGGPTMTDFRTDNSNKDLAFYGGIAFLIGGGVLSAVGVSESTASK